MAIERIVVTNAFDDSDWRQIRQFIQGEDMENDHAGALSAAYRMMRAQQHEAAVTAFRILLREHPDDADMWHDLGHELERCGQPDEAEKADGRSIQLDPNNVCSYNNLAWLLRAQCRINEALCQYEVALALAPEDADVGFGYAMFLDEIGQFAESDAQYVRLLQLNPDHFSGIVNLGIAYYLDGKFDDAQKLLERAISLDPTSPLPHYHLGRLAEERDDNQTAARHFRNALLLDPSDPDYLEAANRHDTFDI